MRPWKYLAALVVATLATSTLQNDQAFATEVAERCDTAHSQSKPSRPQPLAWTALSSFEVALGSSVLRAEDLELQLRFAPRLLDPLVIKVGTAIGWKERERKGVYGGHTVGLGVRRCSGKNSWMWMFDAWYKYHQYETDPNKVSHIVYNGTLYADETAFSTTLFYSRSFNQGRYVISPGVRFYFREGRAIRQASPLEIIVMVGLQYR